MDVTGGDKNQINITNSTLTNSPVAFRQELQNSYNTAQEARDEELKGLLKQLLDETAEALATIEDSQARENLKDDAESFVKEASKPKPRRSLLEVTGQGIVGAVKTVAKVAEPILKIVDMILKRVPDSP